ncbi:VOC family protein [Sphingomonas sp. A2-49]|uniref:glyoxalase superfamily protein n=1 Tax=Sphingomonas sp. A2-49 TaxID=1391375 RepID=UPI0021CF2899|nr:glyoxalase superfamily protein [Sphingomonas sp. A2-49]MCU6453797.1 VOC family protein [Sphingomonas sp. A2-49]
MTESATAGITFGRAAPGICVRDIDAAHDFYAGVLGFRKVFENGDPVGFMVMAKDRAEIHLSRKPGHEASTTNVMHLFVSDVAALYAVCERAGVRIVKRLADKDYGQRAFVLADPDGNRIDVGERRPAARDGGGDERG